MALRSGHGRGRGTPRVEVMPVDELPAGVQAHSSPAPNRDRGGKLVPGPGTRELARKAAAAKHEATAIGRLAGLWDAPEGHPLRPYQRLGAEWRKRQLSELAANVGGGRVGPGPASIIASAAMQLAASRYLYDLGIQSGDPNMLVTSSRLADASRQNVLGAHELAAKEAQARPQDPRRRHDFVALTVGGRDD